jgi:hypothetical protein
MLRRCSTVLLGWDTSPIGAAKALTTFRAWSRLAGRAASSGHDLYVVVQGSRVHRERVAFRDHLRAQLRRCGATAS